MNERGSIALFAGHPVAANLLMLLMILAGVYGLMQINKQLFPDFDFEYVIVSIPWRGASPEDVERSITIPVEQNLKTLADKRRLIARSEQGLATFFIEMEDDVDLSMAMSDVRQRIDTLRNLPQDIEKPVISKIDKFALIAHVLVYTERGNLAELRTLVRNMESDLIRRGMGRVTFSGLPQEEMAIQIPSSQLHQLGMSLEQVAGQIRQFSIDVPAGTLGRNEAAKQLRGLGQRRDESGFSEMPLLTDNQGQLLRLGDIALIERRARDEQPYLTYKGFPAIEMQVMRADNADSLQSAEVLRQWFADTEKDLPQGMHMHAYFEAWKHLEDRIMTLLGNAISGLTLVVISLYAFLNARVAFWVTVGIPVSFLLTLFVLHAFGGTINMISLFGLILALGIIVDDTIIVGEDTLTHLQQGDPPLKAAIGGARRMFWPVIASSLTTIAAFLPLTMMGGAMGKIAFDIPFVMICVILASLLECFLVLPGHLHHSFSNTTLKSSKLREAIDRRFNHFREYRFRPWIEAAIRHRYVTVTAAFCAFVVAVGIVATGWLKFTFFPTIDADQIRAVVEFTSGTDQQTVNRFLNHLEQTLEQTDREFDNEVVKTVVQMHRVASGFPNIGGTPEKYGDHYGTLLVEAHVGSDRRSTNDEFIQRWREKIVIPPGIDQLTIGQPDSGPPGKALELRLGGPDIAQLKQASLAIQEVMLQYAGVSNVGDDLPWGKEQLTFVLTDQGRALGLTLATVASQLRSAFDGNLAQIFTLGDEEVEVRVMLPDDERNTLLALDRLPIITASGEAVPLTDVAKFKAVQGFDMLRRVDGALAVVVSADVDISQGNANQILADMQQTVLPDIIRRYDIHIDFEGQLKEQAENLQDIQTGQMIALSLIYIILVWVFGSWSWPLVVMSAIMLGFIGAVIGHIVVAPFGVAFSMFSVMGLFGLAGIITNDSIVLVSFFKHLVAEGMDRSQAIVEACVQRFRAVFLTSLTTIAGLFPVLLEGSLQAQFLKPMVVSLIFGLAFGTVLILAVVPSMMMIIEDISPSVNAFGQRLGRALSYEQLPDTARRLWQFNPRHYRRSSTPEPGLRGSLWWPLLLLLWLVLKTVGVTLLQLSNLLANDPPAPYGVLLSGLLLLLLVLWQALSALLALIRQQLAVRRHSYRLVILGVPLLLILSLVSRQYPQLYPLADAHWSLARSLLLGGGLTVLLLRWLKRARTTFVQ